VPLPAEFRSYAKLVERFGSESRIERLCSAVASQDALAEAREQRKRDFLTYYSMMRLEGMPPVKFAALPADIRADVKAIWGSYRAARQAGEEFLFRLGDADAVRADIAASGVGKKLPDALYVHPSAEEQLGTLTRLLIFAARQVVGDVEYDLVKVTGDGRRVSFLKYDDFDGSPHPELQYSVLVYLPKADYSIRGYTDSLNPPILHRKETFIDPLHPRYAEFADLTRQEEEHGLLSRPDIGTKVKWEELLTREGLQIEAHTLASRAMGVEMQAKAPAGRRARVQLSTTGPAGTGAP